MDLKIDSLEAVINSNANDTIKVNAYIAWDNLIYNNDKQKDKEINLRLVEMSISKLETDLSEIERYFYKKTLGWSYNNLGLHFKNSGQYEVALDYYNKSLGVKLEINDEKGIAHCYMNIGVIFHTQGEYIRALDYYFKCLKIREKLDDQNGIAGIYNNIGAVYHYQDDFTTATKYYNKSLQIALNSGSSARISFAYSNIGNVLFEKGDSAKKSYNFTLAEENYDSSLLYYKKSLGLEIESNSLSGISKCYNNIGTVYFEKDFLDTALSYFKKSADIKLKLGELQGYASALSNAGKVYSAKKDYVNAIKYGLLARENAEKVNAIIEESSSYDLLYESYKGIGDFKNALYMFEQFHHRKDSITNKENINKTIQQQFQYEYAKKSTADSVLQAEALKIKNAELKLKDILAKNQDLEIQQQKSQKMYLYIGLVILALVGVFVYNRLKVTQRQKNIIYKQQEETEKQKKQIELQHHELEETHKEISDSIKYAERLQLAILPPRELMNENLGDGFVLFQPKDVVSGDFYWMQKIGNTVLFAAADCTGHGVPGAMVSVVCSNALNRAVKEFGFIKPSDVLSKTRDIVIETFARSGKDIKDGMDIALCTLHGNQLVFSGANNPLWIVRDKSNVSEEDLNKRGSLEFEDKVLVEFKGNSQPIGLHDHMTDFEQHNISLCKGDTLYIFTDGFADQFGGEKGKKLMYKPFKKKLIELQGSSMEFQKENLTTFFQDWRGANEQVDDVCIIGVRFN